MSRIEGVVIDASVCDACGRPAVFIVAFDHGQPDGVRQHAICHRGECDDEDTFDRRRIEPDLIDLSTGDEYEWTGEGYSHEGDHDASWSRGELTQGGRDLADIATVSPERLASLRYRCDRNSG